MGFVELKPVNVDLLPNLGKVARYFGGVFLVHLLSPPEIAVLRVLSVCWRLVLSQQVKLLPEAPGPM